MAVYQGARRRAPLPLGLDAFTSGRSRGPADADTAERGRATAMRKGKRVAAGRTRRPSSVGIALAAIVVVFGAAFLSLSQSVRVAATGYDIVRLASEHGRLLAISQDLRSDVDRLRSEHAIRKQALDAGMGQLGAPIVVEAR
jgi:hypothetical protein